MGMFEEEWEVEKRKGGIKVEISSHRWRFEAGVRKKRRRKMGKRRSRIW